MRKYYTRPCNFYYGNNSKKLIKEKKALPLAGNLHIAFDQLEIFNRKKSGKIESKIYSINQIKNLDKKIALIIKEDINKIIVKRKNILNIKFNKPQVMGILNITPDSFSDGGLFLDEAKAFKQANLMFKSGAKIIDIGGESTRPGSKPIKEKEEWIRIRKILSRLKKKNPGMILSLDTRKSYVMQKGIEHGVNIINDVSGLSFDKKSFSIIRSNRIPLVLNHMRGTPNTMQNNPKYSDVLLDIYDFFEKKIKFFEKNNFSRSSIIIDPGIGFGKSLEHNLRIISKISIFHSLGCPILIGTSRKRFIEHIVTKFDSPERTGGTLASILYGLSHGVQLFRVHSVNEINQGILVFNRILNTN